MEELKEGALTPDDLAKYGIPPEQPTGDPVLEVPGKAEEKNDKVHKRIGRTEKAVGE
jgi:hypothetical protein